MSTYWAVVPARGGSKGISNKNMRLVCGRPLFWHSVNAAIACKKVNRVILTTDDAEIIESCCKLFKDDVDIVRRPPELATDEAPTEPCIVHAVKKVAEVSREPLPDFVILLQPTSPYRGEGLLRRCIYELESNDADSLLTVGDCPINLWKSENGNASPMQDMTERPRRQDVKMCDRRYFENGSVYITRTSILMETMNRIGGKTRLMPTSRAESVDVDSIEDLTLIRGFMTEVYDAYSL